MLSSVRSETPRAAVLRSLSSTSVHVNREVTIVSSPSPIPAVERARYSYMPSVANGHGRPQTSPIPANVASVEAPLNRWNSTKTSNTNRSSLRYSRGSLQQAPQDEATFDDNRQSMKALSDFLMTRDPPPNNWVSRLSEDERSLSSLKKSTFKLFKKSKSKKEKPPRFLQLPDSAVAAKTRSGARHIAISIPIEHDHIEPTKKPAPLVQETPQRDLSTNSKPDRSAVTILKSVAEGRESGSSYLSSVAKSRKSETELGHIRPASRAKSPELHLDTTKISRDYYTGLETSQKIVEEPPSTKVDLACSPKSVNAVSPVLRQDSVRSDPRHSGGTAYSTVSLGTLGGHSRGPSSVSTAPSATLISSLKLDLSPRKSSMSKVPQSVRAELIHTSKLVNEVQQDEDPLRSVQSRVSETTSQTISTPSPPTVFSTAKAEIVRRYSASGEGGPQIVRSLTPKDLSPAPPKKLPDQTPQDFLRPKTAPPFQARTSAMAQVKEAEARPRSHGRDESLQVTRQSRQDRVKARKQRDIENLRSKSGTRAPLSEAVSQNDTQAITSSKIVAPPRNPKRSIIQSQELARRKGVNSITPIMLVANLAPYMGLVFPSDLPTPRALDKNSGSSTIRSTEYTPPRSLSSSPSDTDHVRSPRRRLTPSSRRDRAGEDRMLSPTGSVLESRRGERREKRNIREREKELDLRLGRIERDNEVLIGVLSGIASGFSELSRRVEKNGLGLGHGGLGRGMGLGEIGGASAGEGERRKEAGLRGVEPVMRELQVLAPSVSRESVKHVGDEFEEDDGGSILL
jgi:hypothetical protein